ncbi:MAG: DNA polymerase IV [Clostridium butyricum]|uniref:DNA polymerase IV n=1 Tax=Clostridium butyricum TaxID=1492 RepID=A0A6N3HCQ3_CLOBU|nr:MULTISPECIES: DNA polymerase IV [Clostridium]MDB2136931.1 DNA polymerase IV [Clostridium butyricum]MDU1117764.1 DNA polymerase IV [Clostridium sp.]MDU1232501.1 DNA polymerase IV [Clostridium sp.]MDU3090115.1 DNA polymerase IV [Clostridium sp.]MDU7714164.1 DNA polymerase IV [Clostridium butyricum]
MIYDNDRIVFHVDVNSAYLSWTAVKLLQYGSSIDIREIPSVIGGDIENRHGIILAASISAKELGIKTGEPIFSAMQKCRELKVYPPDYDWYVKSSNAMVQLLEEYSPKIQRYSIDECFMDCTHFKDNYKKMAVKVKMRISDELGFNCNIGISTNKLLAKMASDFKPKNTVHTLFKEEVSQKMWPLPASDLFMVGRATKEKLSKLNINTIGDIAKADVNLLMQKMHSHGKLIYEYANGIDNSEIRECNYLDIKGIGNSVTISYDVETYEEACRILLALTESATMRLRENRSLCSLVVVSVKTNNFVYYSHQKPLENSTDSTNIIYEGIKKAFREAWKGEKIRQLGVRLTKLCSNEYYQESLFDFENNEKQMKLDKTVDEIRKRFGKQAVIRSTFLHSGINPIEGGTGSKGDYPMMSSIL